MAYDPYRNSTPTVNPKKIITSIAAIFAFIVLLFSAGSIIETLPASQVMLIQSIGGKLTVYTQQGPHFQGFGSVSKYDRRSTINFGQTEEMDRRIKIQFNDGGTGVVTGSISYEVPTDENKLVAIHQLYPTKEALEASLIAPALNKSIYLTGPLMSAKESYGERKTQLIQYVEDQTQNGVYLTQTTTVDIADELNPGATKKVTVSEIRRGSNGQPLRAEEGQLARFGIRVFNFAIQDLDYSEIVDKQIAKQQEITMNVQTSMAEALQAEQRTKTVKAQGEAKAAEAKWEQEAVKARLVTEGESKLAVAELSNKEAEQYRQEKLKRAEADSTYQRKLMEANGALDQRLAAQVKIAELYANAIKDHQGALVPSVIMGGTGSSENNSVASLINLLTAQQAKAIADIR